MRTRSQSRWRSWPTWLAIASLVTFITKTYLHYEIQDFDMLINLSLTALTAMGVLNNPSDSAKF